MLICWGCRSTRFRSSHLRLSDFLQLLAFRLPVRCRDCHARVHTNVFRALVIKHADHVRHSGRRHEHA